LCLQPFDQAQRGRGVLPQPRRQRVQAAVREVDVVRARRQPNWWNVSRRRGHADSLLVTVPMMTSEWPQMYLVAAWIETSTPSASAGNEAASPTCCRSC